jgi:hypothetical protein
VVGPSLVLVGVALVLASAVATFSSGQRWWWKPDVAVPRDGASHTVTLDRPGAPYGVWGDRSLADPTCSLTTVDGTELAQVHVPVGERVHLDEPWVAEPEASATFTAPAGGVVVATCDDVDATPVQSLHLAPMRSRLHYSVMQYGGVLGGLGLLVGGVALAVVRSVRGRRRERAADLSR